MNDLVGASALSDITEDDITDEELDAMMLNESACFGIFANAVSRFMPPNTALMYTVEDIEEILDHLSFDYTGLEDQIEELILTSFYNEEAGEATVIALSVDNFFNAIDLSPETSRAYVEDMLRTGKLVKFQKSGSTENEDDNDE